MAEPLPREELLRRARVIILDDDPPENIEDLRQEGLAIDLIGNTDDVRFKKIEAGFYDVLLLDYGGIGRKHGPEEGLDVLRHLKRINPSLIVLAYTARTFDSSKADFFRMSDGVLRKDAGIRETLEIIEGHLAKAMTVAHQWLAMRQALEGSVQPERLQELEAAIAKAIESPAKSTKVREMLSAMGNAGAEALLSVVLEKIIEIGIRGHV